MALQFTTPGNADILSDSLMTKWNEIIKGSYDSMQYLHSKYFKLNPKDLVDSQDVPIKWFGDPAEPAFCLDSEIALKLSDWGTRGRRETHNEYCEYSIVYAKDAMGVNRPKRVEVTTELREYWVMLAKHDPLKLKEIAESILKRTINWEEFYGTDTPPSDEFEREVSFSKLVAGHGNDERMEEAGVPPDPEGDLNGHNALFMAHPINGLDDLLYIVMFGAKPYVVDRNGSFYPVNKETIFIDKLARLACRHADPAAALGANGAVFNGHKVSFTNSIGMYLHSFAKSKFQYNDEDIPEDWVRFSRGKNGMNQRLEFGPSDDEDIFLDDILLFEGGQGVPVTGGFQIVKNLEVGPFVKLGKPEEIPSEDYIVLNEITEPIDCALADVCGDMKKLYEEYMAKNGRVEPQFERIMKVQSRYEL